MAKHRRQVIPRSASTVGHAQMARQFETLAQRFRQAMDRKDYVAAGKAAEAALRIQPKHMTVLSDYAFCLLRQKRFEEAHKVYMRIYNAPPELQRQAAPTWLDGLAELCGWMEKWDELRKYGNESLQKADDLLGHNTTIKIEGPPPAFDGTRPDQNVISYTLFGDNPRYCESAIMCVQVAAELFPQWRCRIYLDDSVPQDVQQRLREVGAQVIDMTGQPGVHPLMWRFLVADDPTVERFLIRDADSLLSEREQAAVEEWLQSPYWFHHMRDYFSHTELILAGLWGGVRGVLPPLQPLMQSWLSRQENVTRFADQIFLRENVWPIMRQSVLTHDDLFGFHDAHPFPSHAPIRWTTESFHVGSNASFQGIQGQSGKADGERQTWEIRDEQDQVVCRYSSVVHNGEWAADLPFFIIDHITDNRWAVRKTDD